MCSGFKLALLVLLPRHVIISLPAAFARCKFGSVFSPNIGIYQKASKLSLSYVCKSKIKIICKAEMTLSALGFLKLGFQFNFL